MRSRVLNSLTSPEIIEKERTRRTSLTMDEESLKAKAKEAEEAAAKAKSMLNTA